MNRFFLPALFLSLSELCLAAESSFLDPFVRETESLIDEASAGSDRAVAGLASTNSSRKFSRLPDRLPAEELGKFKGRLTDALAELNETVGKEKFCALPSRAKVGIALAKVEMILRDGNRWKKEFETESAELSRKVGPETERELSLTQLRFAYYLENVNEVKTWLSTPAVAGLTREVIARHPNCAGKVITAGLLRIVPGEGQASAANAIAPPKVRVDVYQVDSAGDAY